MHPLQCVCTRPTQGGDDYDGEGAAGGDAGEEEEVCLVCGYTHV